MKIAIYTRVSTEDQAREGYSLTIQKEYLIDFAKRHGWDIHFRDGKAKIYEDDGYSGYSLERPALKQLLNDARAKKFGLILVYKLDRFSRKLRDILNILDELESLDVQFQSATEPYDTRTSAGKLMLQQLGSFAEFERNRIIERVFPGMIKGVKDGHWQGARYTPYGYFYNKTKKLLELVPEEAKIVKRIYELYLSGNSTTKIASIFYEKGIPTRSGGKFNTKFICDVLKNKVYLGKLVWNKRHYDTKQKTRTGKGFRYVKNPDSVVVEVQGTHEPIITSSIFERVQDRLKKNCKTSIVRFKNNIYYLSGVLYCHMCGMKFYGAMIVQNHRTGRKTPWYRCGSQAYSYLKKCYNPQVQAEKVHAQVWRELRNICKTNDFEDGVESFLEHTYAEPQEHYNNQLTIKKNALKRNIEKQDELYGLYKEDKMGLEFYKRKADDLRSEEKNIKTEIKRIETILIDQIRGIDERLRAQNFLMNMRDKNYKWSDADKKEFMSIIFKKLSIKDGKLVNVEKRFPWNIDQNKKELQCRKRKMPSKRNVDPSVYNCPLSAAR